MSNSLSLLAQWGESITPEIVLEGLPHPVLVVGPAGEIAFANAAAQAEFGRRVLGLACQDIFLDFRASLSWRSARGPVTLTASSQRCFEALTGVIGGGMTVVSLRPVGEGDTSSGPSQPDELTGLCKRHALADHLERALTAADRGGAPVAVHCLDLDRFKMINDTLGHGVGDLLLRRVADRLRSACRQEDCIARIGGDEFVIVQAGAQAAQNAETLAARLVDLVGRTYVLSGHTVNIGVSIGVALSAPALSARDLVRNADLALYEAKRAGRGRWRLFETGMDASLRERRELEIDLRRALALKQFELHYQPFVELSGGRVIGFEALLRWEHPVRGRVSPLDFVPLAEETGLIGKIGEWVLRTACATAATWPDNLMVAVNVSPVQFKTDMLVETVVSALAHAGLPAHRLEIEITEGALLDNTESVLATLNSLRELGVKISMDDFGTGYSSLSYLQKFPFSKIKIDRSFIQGADTNADSLAILKAIAGLGSSLGMAITAEGVETAEQLERIRSEHCTHVQGYYTGRPMSPGHIEAFLRT